MNLVIGLRDTLEILAFRWKMIRKLRIRAIFFLAGFFGLSFLFSLSYVGNILKFGAQLASDASDSSLSQLHGLAIAYLRTFLASDGQLAATTILVGLFGALFMIPLLGYTASGMVPAADIISVRRNDYHRISDSLVLQFFSSISLIQIIVVLLLNSLISISSSAPGLAILIGWGLWLLFTVASTLVSWLFEYIHRRFGGWAKYAFTGGVFATGGIIYLLFPKQANNLFGLSGAYIDLVRNAGQYTLGQQLLVLGGFLFLLIALSAALSLVGSRTLNLAERASKRKARSIVLFGSKRPRISLYVFMLNNVLRQSNIRKPLIFATGFAFVSVLAFAGSTQVLQSLLFVIPLIVTMSWGANTFGILGSGTTWLLSLPNGRKDMLKNILLVQFTLIGILHLVVVLPMIVLFHTDGWVILNFSLSTAIVSVIMSRSALAKSVYGPERYRVHVRGENVLPPGKALGYLGRFILGPGMIGMVFFVLGGTAVPLGTLGALIAISAYQFVRFLQLQSAWSTKTSVVQNIISTVGAD